MMWPADVYGWVLPLFPSEITGFYNFAYSDSHNITSFEISIALSDVIEPD